MALYTKQVPEEAQVYSPEVQGSELAVCPPHWPEDLVLLHLMIAAAQAALELHMPHQPLLVDENKGRTKFYLRTCVQGDIHILLHCWKVPPILVFLVLVHEKLLVN